MSLGMDIMGICVGVGFAMFVYGECVLPKKIGAKVIDELKALKGYSRTSVFYEAPNGKRTECKLEIITDETGCVIVVANPIKEE